MFMIIKGQDERYILYFRAKTTYEMIAAVDGKENIISKLKKFCNRFRSKAEMFSYMRNFTSANTEMGLTFRDYFSQIEGEWERIYKPVWSEVISQVINSCFISVKLERRKRFKVIV